MTHRTSEAVLKQDASFRYWDIARSTFRYILSRTMIKRWRTDRIVLPGSSHVLFVDPTENRGRVLYMTGGRTQPRLSFFWSTAVAAFEPDFVLDVGVNYGECLFSVSYPKRCRILGIEANPHLQSFIERSRKKHPNRSSIQTVYAMASDEEHEKRSFYIHKYWSGLSSAIRGQSASPDRFREHEIRSVTVDALLSKYPLERSKLLFKIDVEGHEENVLKGMLHTIARCPRMLGFIEFDSKYLSGSGTDVNAFLTFLQERFSIYVYPSNQELVHIRQISMEKLQHLFKKKHIHTDFILASSPALLPKVYSKLTSLE